MLYMHKNESSYHSHLVLILIITMLFGLVHGFGFAGNLSSIGLMQDRFIPALIGFNLGVEIGQVLIILCLFTLVFLLKSLINFRVEILRI